MSQVLLVTGAAGGLGRAIVARAASVATDAGVQIAVVSRDAQHLTDAFGQAHTHIVADVSTYEGAQLAVKRCVETVGAPTMLAHCVGSILLAPVATPPRRNIAM